MHRHLFRHAHSVGKGDDDVVTSAVMAKILELGRYVTQTATEERQKVLRIALALTGGLFTFLGFLSGEALRTSPWWAVALCACGFVTLLRVIFILLRQRIEALEGKAIDSQKPEKQLDAVGEAIRRLPEGFQVIDGLSTAFGDVDHVVIGHTGVFVLNTKSWKGVVAADGNGELLWNGHQIDSPLVQEFSSKVSRIDETIRSLADGLNVPIQALLVFPSAQVDAEQGTTGEVHCIRANQLNDYILDTRKRKQLPSQGVEEVGHAFLALARINSIDTGVQYSEDRASAQK